MSPDTGDGSQITSKVFVGPRSNDILLFIDLSFVNIRHFSAVMHPMKHETLVEMDVSMVKFANVNVDSVHYFQTTDLLTFIE